MAFLLCPLCQRALQVPEQYAGQHMKCEHCQGLFSVPEQPGSPPPVAQPPVAPAAPANMETTSATTTSTVVADEDHLSEQRDQPRDERGRWPASTGTTPAVPPPPLAAGAGDQPSVPPPVLADAAPQQGKDGKDKDGKGGDDDVPPEVLAVRARMDRIEKEWPALRDALAAELKAWAEAGGNEADDPALRMSIGQGNYLKVLAGLMPDTSPAAARPEVRLARCPHCGQANRIRIEMAIAGRQLVCGKCDQPFLVPTEDQQDYTEAKPPPVIESGQDEAAPSAAAYTGPGAMSQEEMDRLNNPPPPPSPPPPEEAAADAGTDTDQERTAFAEAVRRAKAEQEEAYRQSRGQFLRERQVELEGKASVARQDREARNRARRGADQRRVASRAGLGFVYQAMDFGQDVATALGVSDEGPGQREQEVLAEVRKTNDLLQQLLSKETGDGASYAERNVGEPVAEATGKVASPGAKQQRQPSTRMSDTTLNTLARAINGPAQRPSQPAGGGAPGHGGGRNNWIGEILRFLGM